jgi:hypothetical protein
MILLNWVSWRNLSVEERAAFDRWVNSECVGRGFNPHTRLHLPDI